jgi:hypothetical protein
MSCGRVWDCFDDSGIFEEKECIQILRTKKFAKNKMTINAK